MQPSGVEQLFIVSRIPPSADDTSILCSWNFLIFHAVALSFLSSGLLKMALHGQSDQLIFTRQSLINDKITALSQMKVTASRSYTFSSTRKVLLSMMTWMKDSNIWLN